MQRILDFRVPSILFDVKSGILIAGAALGGLTAVLAPWAGEGELTVVAMAFLLTVLVLAAFWGYVVGLAAALLADLLLNVFFVSPVHSLTVQDPHNIATLAVFLCVAVVGAFMLSRFREQVDRASARRAELAAMLDLSRQVAAASGPGFALDAIVQSITRTLGARKCDLAERSEGGWKILASVGGGIPFTRDEVAVANRSLETGTIARRLPERAGKVRVGPARERSAVDTFVPFGVATGHPGVLRISGELVAPGDGDLDNLMRAFSDEAGMAVHRARLAEQAKHAEANQRADEFKSALLSSVSHDLRSPLTAIKAAVGSLRSEGIAWSPDDQRQFLETIESQTDRLTDTVDDLLDMSRLDAGSVHLELEPIDVRLLLEDATRATAAATGSRPVHIEVDSGLWVRADYGLMLRALGNLIENAAKYSLEGGAIFLRGEAKGGRAVITVSDEGPGISAEDLPFIFEKFYRGKRGQKTQGSGLGLSIVRAMVGLNRGQVTVDSTPQGTAFRISLPVAGAPG